MENPIDPKVGELLLPVANMQMCLAAIHNGADAIYVGVPKFNARGRTADLSIEQLREMIEQCHLYGVKVNLAFNIVIFESELADAVKTLREVLLLGPDAIIVQDLGLAQLIREIAPNQVIHASTQMTITNYEAIKLLDDLNIKRFVLGRENSIKEIEAIKQKTDKELEVFVHGALCVAYSGQCFTSESIGGRSANRGQCAQSCRFSYDLLVDGVKRDLVDETFLVSPQDLCGIDEIPQLQRIGVSSFKIEGRLKSPEYVATTAKSYRLRMDQEQVDTRPLVQKMATTYSRGFYSGWLHGVNHQQLVDGTYGSHRGLQIGTLQNFRNGWIEILLSNPIELTPGDGLLLVSPTGNETGGHIYQIQSKSNLIVMVKFEQDFNQTQFLKSKIYLNHDHKLQKEVSRSMTDKLLTKKIGVQIEVEIVANQPLKVRMHDGQNHVEAISNCTIQPASSNGTTDQFIIDELSALSGTPYICSNVIIGRSNKEALYIPQKELKILRRELVQKLSAMRVDRSSLSLRSDDINLIPSTSTQSLCPTKLNILLREYDQVEAFVDWLKTFTSPPSEIDIVILDFEFGKDYKRSVDLLRSVGLKSAIATTRVLKPNEYHNFRLIERSNPDAILVRNLGALYYFKTQSEFKGPLIGDFSLNVTNHLSYSYLVSKGLSSISLSYDLNIEQINDLLANIDRAKAEITIYQYMPSFHMEHCVFAAFMSEGKDFRNCGRPCEKHRVELVDQFGNHHQIKADQECRNTMFNAVAQSATASLKDWMKLGVGHIRYEALYETKEELILKVSSLLKYLKNEIDDSTLAENLGASEKYGLSSGNLTKKDQYRPRKNIIN